MFAEMLQVWTQLNALLNYTVCLSSSDLAWESHIPTQQLGLNVFSWVKKYVMYSLTIKIKILIREQHWPILTFRSFPIKEK
jgi:hypothetical protein